MPVRRRRARTHPTDRRRPLALGLLTVLLVSGCTGSGEGERAPDEGPRPSEAVDAPARERAVGARLTPEGTVPLDLALDLVATGYGPIEGGTADEALRGGLSGTTALAGLLPHLGELTPAQRTTVDAAFGPSEDDQPPADAAPDGGRTPDGNAPDGGRTPGDGRDGEAAVIAAALPAATGVSAAALPTAALPGAVGAVTMSTDASDPPLPDLTPMILRARLELQRRLGFRMVAPISWSESDPPADSEWTASAGPMRDGRLVGSGPMDRCSILVYPAARAYVGTETLTAMITHEVAHCLSYAMVDDVAVTLRSPQWVLEGFSEFASATIVAADDSRAAWLSWLEEPEVPLSRREYSGLGAFAVAQQSGVDVWDRFEPMLGRTHADALETLFGTSPDRAMTSIAQSLVREPGLGTAWEATGPGLPDARGTHRATVGESRDLDERVSLVPWATAPYAIEFTGDVLDVEVDGAVGRIGLPGGVTHEITSTTSTRFCVEGSCECPDGGHMVGTEIADDGVVGLALVAAELTAAPGRSQRIQVRMTVPTVEEACRTRPSAAILVVRVTAPDPFEIHGGHCVRQDNGLITVQAGQDRMPDGYRPPPAHRDDASIDIVKDPATPPHHGTVTLRLGGVEQPHDDLVTLDADLLGGSFRTGNGVAGDWRCAELVSPEDLWGTGD